MTTQPFADVLGAAAAILTEQGPPVGAAADLLSRLGYLDGHPEETAHRAILLRSAMRFRRMFSLRAEDAPGLVALGAEIDAAAGGDAPTGGVSGAGLELRQAFESCVGEAAEYASSFAAPDDRFEKLADSEVPPPLRSLWERLHPARRDPAATHSDWAHAADLADGSPVLLPADLCFRRAASSRDIDPPWPLSTGCGAGVDLLDATLHGLLELIERDATILWLRGGLSGRAVPPGPGAVLSRLRQEARGRLTWLLDITSDVRVPVVAALSCAENGFGLCRGIACRPTLAAAADAALIEMAQMELAYRLSATKQRLRGDAALSSADRQHIQRYTSVDAAANAALQPIAPPATSCNLTGHDNVAVLHEIRSRLRHVGVEVYAVNLTKPSLGIPVARAFAPGLEMGMTAPPGPRLRRQAERSGADLSCLVSV
jgi:ribosomal protein S12 methylthiotransferase accessory factor